MKPVSKDSVTRGGEHTGWADDFEGWDKFVEVCGAKNVRGKRSPRRKTFSRSLVITIDVSIVVIVIIIIIIVIIIAISMDITITIIIFFISAIALVIGMLSGGVFVGAGTFVKENDSRA